MITLCFVLLHSVAAYFGIRVVDRRAGSGQFICMEMLSVSQHSQYFISDECDGVFNTVAIIKTSWTVSHKVSGGKYDVQ